MTYRDDDARDEALAMYDPEPRPFHRCPWPDFYGCRRCMHMDDDEWLMHSPHDSQEAE